MPANTKMNVTIRAPGRPPVLASAATSIHRNRMTMTAGQMKTQRAAPSDRQAPRVSAARRVARVRSAGPSGTGASDSASTTLSLDAKAGDIGAELGVLARLVRDPVPAIGD